VPRAGLHLRARGAMAPRTQGWEAGADDYLAKPLLMEGLMAGAEALGASGPVNPLKVADLQMNVLRRRVPGQAPASRFLPENLTCRRPSSRSPVAPFRAPGVVSGVGAANPNGTRAPSRFFAAQLRKKSGPRVRCPAHLDRSRHRPRPSCSGVNEPVPAADER
jgi:hypothetical protein